MMRKLLLALSGAAAASALTAAQTPAKTFACGTWENGICVKMHRVKGTLPYAVGHVFGPNYSYTAISDIPQPVVAYYKLNTTRRYVYSDGYLYDIDPATYAVTQVIDTYAH